MKTSSSNLRGVSFLVLGMLIYSSLVYLIATLILTPITLFVGNAPNAHPSIACLLHPWIVPTVLDGTIMAGLGWVGAGLALFSGLYVLYREQQERTVKLFQTQLT